MKLSELFTISFTIGFILGLFALGVIGYVWYLERLFPIWETLALYLALCVLTLTVSSESNTNMKTFMFLQGINIPITILVLLIFYYVDLKYIDQDINKN